MEDKQKIDLESVFEALYGKKRKSENDGCYSEEDDSDDDADCFCD